MTTTRWNLVITRLRQEKRDDLIRTVGRYQVYHGHEQILALRGDTAEPGGPGDNDHVGNDKRLEEGNYPIATHNGEKYLTIGYAPGMDHPRPALELMHTSKRVAILFHPGHGFLSSIGCINPARYLPSSAWDVSYGDSRDRVVAIINDLRAFFGEAFPTENGQQIHGATITILGEPRFLYEPEADLFTPGELAKL